MATEQDQVEVPIEVQIENLFPVRTTETEGTFAHEWKPAGRLNKFLPEGSKFPDDYVVTIPRMAKPTSPEDVLRGLAATTGTEDVASWAHGANVGTTIDRQSLVERRLRYALDKEDRVPTHEEIQEWAWNLALTAPRDAAFGLGEATKKEKVRELEAKASRLDAEEQRKASAKERLLALAGSDPAKFRATVDTVSDMYGPEYVREAYGVDPDTYEVTEQ